MKRQGISVQQSDRHLLRKWVALLGPIALYAGYFNAIYLLAEYSCGVQQLPLGIVTLSVLLGVVALLLLAGLARLSWQVQQRDDQESRFMGRVGLWLSGLSVVLTLATIGMILLLDPC